MKKVIMNKELISKMRNAVDLLCDTVKATLGPTGNNIIVNCSNCSPFITNDGVTIAESIESEDKIINTILTIAKEASINTNNDVGDGTTTTLVLLQGIFNEGLKYVENGVNPIILKKKLNEGLNIIIEQIKKYSTKPSKKDLYNIANTSCGDSVLAKHISDAYYKTKNKNAIRIKEINSNYTYIKYLKGYSIDTQIASLYFFNKGKIEYNNPYLLLVNNDIKSIDEMASIINYIAENKEKLIVIANSYSELVVNEIVSIFLENNIDIILLNTPMYGTKNYEVLKDLSIIFDTNIVTNRITLKDIKMINNVSINKDITTFTFNKNNNIKRRIKDIKNSLNDNINDIDTSFITSRINMLNNVIAEINIGCNTSTELREKKMRIEDALCALDITKNGVCIGSGIIFHKISEELNDNLLECKIFKTILKDPFKQIMYNAGLNYNEIIGVIKNNNYNCLYNVKTCLYEYNNYNVIDPTDILIESLVNATSIASMLLTTTSLVINDYDNNNCFDKNIEI